VPPAVTLWRSKRDGKPRGFIRASWREGGRKVTWDTRSLDEGEARTRALAELDRRLSARPEPPQQAERRPDHLEGQPPVKPGEPSNVIPMRRPIGDALNRALGVPAPAAAAPSSPPDEGPAKARKLYELFGKAMGHLTEGGLKRAVRWAGREPEDMDDDELVLVRGGWEELGAEWFGRVEIGPWGRIALGSAVAGVGMYMGGDPIKPPEQKQLPAAAAPADGANVRPERDEGGGGG
jgi:hypothetical protein